MDLAVDLALAGRTSIYRRLATTDDGLEAATEYSSAINEPLVRRKSPRAQFQNASQRSLGKQVAAVLTPGQQLAAAFFCTVMGIGSTVGWFAVAGGVAYFGVTRHSTADAVRQALFLWLLIAYYVPLMLLLTLQRACARNRCNGSGVYAFRMLAGYLGMGACVALVPFADTTSNLLLLTAGLGAFTALAFGVVSKLFKLLPMQCYGYFVAGASAASVVAIGLAFCTGLSKGTPEVRPSYETYGAAAGLVVLGAISGVLLVLSRLGRYYMEQGRIDLDMAAAGSFRTDGTTCAVLCRTWPSQLALAILVTPTVVVTGLVGFIPAQTDTWRNPGFCVVLVFLIMVSFIIGRQLRCRAHADGLWSPSGGALVSWGLLRLLLGGAIIVYSAQPKLEGSAAKMVLSDAAVIAALVVFAGSGGALIPYVFESGTSKVHAQARGKLDTVHGTVGCLSCIAGLAAALCIAYVLGGHSVFDLPITARSLG